MLDLRRWPLAPVRLVGCYRYRCAHEPLAAHSHGDLFELCYLASGGQTYEVEGKLYQLRGGDFLLTRPGERHSTGGWPEERGVLYWMLFARPRAGESFLGLPPAEGRWLGRALATAPHHHFRGGPEPALALAQMMKVPAERSPGAALELRLQLLRFLLMAAQCARRPQRTELSVPVQRALAAVAAPGGLQLDLAGLSAVSRLSPTRLQAHFKAEVGCSPGDYLLRQRVAQAVRWLRSTRRPVTDIAFELGFSSSQYFATVFKRYTMRTPLEARRTGR